MSAATKTRAHRKTLALGAALAGAVLVAACTSAGTDAEGKQESNSTTALDRLLIGQAAGYRADKEMRARLPELRASQAARRSTAWTVIQKAIEPVGIDEQGRSLPRFQTWYGKDEIVPMFEHILLGQTEAERQAHTPPSAAVIEETFSWAAKRASTLASFSEERLAKRRAELDAGGGSGLGGQDRVLMSPALVGHLLTHYDAMLRCLQVVPDGATPPPSETNFAPCVGDEFPAEAAIVKARWVPDTGPITVQETSGPALTSVITGTGEAWAEGTGTASPDPESIYTMQLSDGMRSRLVALHVITKELRDWMWITMFWSDTPRADFGSDRPAEMTGPWGGYKMCAVVDYDEGDDGSHDAALDPSLAAALAATRAFGPRTWCSNPFLEQGPHNAKTNCIGCHQHAGTRLTTTTILDGPTSFPDGSREKVRKNFPADYTFVTSTGLELASRIRDKFDQFAPVAAR